MPTPPASTPVVDHEPPSLPASPLPKRTKVLPEEASAVPSTLAASVHPTSSGTATPTPLPETSVDSLTTPGTQEGGAMATVRETKQVVEAASPPLQVKKLSDKARAPTRGSAFAAGYDVYASKETAIPARGRALVDTDISIAVPAGTYGRIAPRSGLAVKHGIDVGAGVIDADYRGQVKILLFNFSDTDFEIKEGDRIAQLVIERIYTPDVMVVEELEETVRGAGGFGSTGGFATVQTTLETAPAPPA